MNYKLGPVIISIAAPQNHRQKAVSASGVLTWWVRGLSTGKRDRGLAPMANDTESTRRKQHPKDKTDNILEMQ